MASRRRLAALALALALALAAVASAGAGSPPSPPESAPAPAVPLISTPAPLAIQLWQATTDNLVPVIGRVTLGGAPVAGVVLRVGDYELTPTNDEGRFTYLADSTALTRDVVSVADDSDARVHGDLLTPAEQYSLAAQQAAITVAYAISDLHAALNGRGEPTISGRITFSDHRTAPPTVTLYTYQLTGTVTDASGKPVAGAIVSTRTGDRNYWTISTPTDAAGHYSSLFTASDEAGDNPVPMNVEVAIGNVVYSFPSFEFVEFSALRSAHLDIQLPPNGYAMPLPLPQSYPGAVYQGVVVGAGAGASGTSAIRPLQATWPGADGRFSITLPHAFAGHTVSLWEADLQLFQTGTAAAGSPIEVGSLPSSLPGDAPRGLVSVRLP